MPEGTPETRGSALGTILRLIAISVVVGIVLSALGIRPENIVDTFRRIAQRISDMGFGAVERGLAYLLLGAMVVVPVWLIARLFGRR